MSTSPTPEPAPPAPDLPVREIGRVGRAHGVRGELTVSLLTDRADRLAVGAWVRAGDEWMQIAAARKLPDRWLVSFGGVGDRSAAEAMAHRSLFALADDSDDDPDALWVHHVIGAPVVDQHGVDRGRCVAVLDNPADHLLELDSGALVPARFAHRRADGTVVVDAPDGLFEL